jgi:hypothetical protein
MRRRLELTHPRLPPPVLFLDELKLAWTQAAAPICGPSSASWSRTARPATTQYLKEADHLADDVVVIDEAGPSPRARHRVG